ncbi:hypothetical protein B0H17DRAFT_1039626 [Mycena rosella]|uniref:Uncharacterized protein n=1 Tax=Mycena rosella TaxID=1033263 RepID=A0AAD7M7B7_MYCRO|nr:hypothetical protein B0H17DRAFT_1039626 [Mycena rosella]
MGQLCVLLVELLNTAIQFAISSRDFLYNSTLCTARLLSLDSYLPLFQVSGYLAVHTYTTCIYTRARWDASRPTTSVEGLFRTRNSVKI